MATLTPTVTATHSSPISTVTDATLFTITADVHHAVSDEVAADVVTASGQASATPSHRPARFDDSIIDNTINSDILPTQPS